MSVFLRNKVAVSALVFIAGLFFLSLIAYLIIPDNTPNANRQLSSIALKPPGFSTKILKPYTFCYRYNKK